MCKIIPLSAGNMGITFYPLYLKPVLLILPFMFMAFVLVFLRGRVCGNQQPPQDLFESQILQFHASNRSQKHVTPFNKWSFPIFIFLD